VAKALGATLKNDFAEHIEKLDLTAKDKTMRSMQHQRFMQDYKDAVQAFSETATAVATAERKFPLPNVSNSATTGGAAAQSRDTEDERMCVDRYESYVVSLHAVLCVTV
jgi:septal ring-binding cell division protein DamX